MLHYQSEWTCIYYNVDYITYNMYIEKYYFFSKTHRVYFVAEIQFTMKPMKNAKQDVLKCVQMLKLMLRKLFPPFISYPSLSYFSKEPHPQICFIMRYLFSVLQELAHSIIAVAIYLRNLSVTVYLLINVNKRYICKHSHQLAICSIQHQYRSSITCTMFT